VRQVGHLLKKKVHILHCGSKISSEPEVDSVASKHVAVWIILYSCVWWLFIYSLCY